MEKMRVQKFIARSGFCSRRKAEELIKQSRVFVGENIVKIGDRIVEDSEVFVDGEKIFLEKKKIYIILNKPIGYTCTNRKFLGEKNIFDLLDVKERLFIVGRLDKNSRGLVLLTNDGDLAQRLTHPKFEYPKIYEALIENIKVDIKEILKKFKEGVTIIGNEKVGVIVKVKDIKYLGDNRFEIILTEGKKRQIRKMFKRFGCEVKDLVRIEIGKLRLGNLKQGEWRYLTNDEIKNLTPDI